MLTRDTEGERQRVAGELDSSSSPPQTSPAQRIVGLQRAAGNAAVAAAVQRAVVEEQGAKVINMEYLPQLAALFDGALGGISVVTQAINKASGEFRSVQTAQAETDKHRLEVFKVLMKTGALAAGVVGLAAEEALETTADAVEKAFEAGETAADAAGLGLHEPEAPPTVQPHGLPSSMGDPLEFLAAAQAKVYKKRHAFDTACGRIGAKLRRYTAAQWQSYNVGKYASALRDQLAKAQAAGLTPPDLVDSNADALARRYQLEMWKAWLRERAGSAVQPGKLGTDVEKHLNKLGIPDKLGITLTGEWYDPNSPGAEIVLVAWARGQTIVDAD
jgi:hypothetical protein